MRYPDPDEILSGEIGEWLASLEQEREAASKTGLKRLAVTVPVILGALLYALLAEWGDWLNVSFAGLAALGLAYSWARAPVRALMPALKIELNSEIARAMELEYQPYPDANFAFQCAEYFGMLPSYDQVDFEDLWLGEIDGRAFEVIEAQLRKESARADSREMRQVFRGALVSIQTNAAFTGALLVREKDAFRDLRETYVLSGPASPPELGLQPMETGNSDFDAQFECFCEDPDEASRLVTSQLMAELIGFQSHFPAGRKTAAVFHEGHLVLVVNSGNMFETGSRAKFEDRALVANTIRQFAKLADVAKAV